MQWIRDFRHAPYLLPIHNDIFYRQLAPVPTPRVLVGATVSCHVLRALDRPAWSDITLPNSCMTYPLFWARLRVSDSSISSGSQARLSPLARHNAGPGLDSDFQPGPD